MLAMVQLRTTWALILTAGVTVVDVCPAGAQVLVLPRASPARRTDGPLLALILVAPPVAGPGVSGVWRWTVQEINGPEADVVLTLKQEGEIVTGTIASPRGQVEIRDGTFKDGELSFALRAVANGRHLATWYKGKVKGDTISGKIEVETDGEVLRTLDWEAKFSPKESAPGDL
jgi:hypothetical protein